MRGLESLVLVILFVGLLLVSPTLISGQQILRLENQSYNQKNSFSRGEQIFVVVAVPVASFADVLIHYPPNSPGPSPKRHIQNAAILPNVETRLGPITLEQNAPCGKYQVEVVVTPPNQSLYTFFDYAANEYPCTPPPTPSPPPTDFWTLVTTTIAAVAVVAAVVLLFTRRRPAASKAPAVPVTPPAIPPTTTVGPPKQAPRMSPQVRRVEEDRGD
ncbi:MAG: hypothetical protein QXO30_01905 [Candidatus Caldarchaeum sp.]